MNESHYEIYWLSTFGFSLFFIFYFYKIDYWASVNLTISSPHVSHNFFTSFLHSLAFEFISMKIINSADLNFLKYKVSESRCKNQIIGYHLSDAHLPTMQVVLHINQHSQSSWSFLFFSFAPFCHQLFGPFTGSSNTLVITIFGSQHYYESYVHLFSLFSFALFPVHLSLFCSVSTLLMYFYAVNKSLLFFFISASF